MIGIGFLICVFGIGIINLLLPSKKISEEENRELQQKPELSVSAVTSGSYMDQYENCLLYTSTMLSQACSSDLSMEKDLKDVPVMH